LGKNESFSRFVEKDAPDGGDGSRFSPFNKIQDAVDSVPEGGIVYVGNGTFFENIIISKSIIITGNGTNLTLINGMGKGDVVKIEADWVTFGGITATGSGGGPRDAGIKVEGNHAGIFETECINNSHGLYLRNSDYHFISNNSFNANHQSGIQIERSYYNDIINNTCSGNRNHGVILYYSKYNQFLGNQLFNNSLYITGDLGHWNTHTIPNDNLVNGKPLVYLKDLKDIKVPSESGQIIVVNCTEGKIEDQNCSYKSVGILIGFSKNISIDNVICSWNLVHGLELIASDNCVISNSTFHQNEMSGILIVDSNFAGIENNSLQNNKNGIEITGSHYGTMCYNDFKYNKNGIELWDSNHAIIFENNIYNNTNGIYIQSLSMNINAQGNFIFNNSLYGIIAWNNENHAINSKYTWWGDDSGPFHYRNHTNGSGDKVSDFVDFDPWIGKQQDETFRIITDSVMKAYEDEEYSVYYHVDENPNSLQWNLSTNALFLEMNQSSGHLSGLPEQKDVGSFWVSVSASDGFYTTYQNFPLEVINVNDLPVVEILDPENGSTIQTDKLINGSVEDVDSDIEIVEIRIDTGEWNEVVGKNEWTYVLNTRTMENGVHTISVRAYDGFTYSKSVKISVMVNNTVQELDKPDLIIDYFGAVTIYSVEVPYDDKNNRTAPGTYVNLTAVIKNDGHNIARNITVEYRIITNDENAEMIHVHNLWYIIDNLTGGSSSSKSMKWYTDEIVGEYIIQILVDPENHIEEIDEENNERSISVNILKGRKSDYGVVITALVYNIVLTEDNYTAISLTINNIGKYRDSYSLSVDGDYPGWNVTLSFLQDLSIEGGEEYTITVFLRPEQNSTLFNERIHVTIKATSNTYPEIWDSVRVDGQLRDDEGNSLPDMTIPLIVISLSAGIFVGFFIRFTEVGKFAFFSTFFVLYHRLKKNNTFNDFNRGLIMGYIVANPGVTYTELMKSLEMKNGTLSYHLNVLERERMIISNKLGLYKIFYPRLNKASKSYKQSPRYYSTGKLNDNFFPSILQQKILEAIEEFPGILQLEIRKKLDMTRQSLNYHIKMLKRAGLIRIEKDRRTIACYPLIGELPTEK